MPPNKTHTMGLIPSKELPFYIRDPCHGSTPLSSFPDFPYRHLPTPHISFSQKISIHDLASSLPTASIGIFLHFTASSSPSLNTFHIINFLFQSDRTVMFCALLIQFLK
jgi:hypothetical protein